MVPISHTYSGSIFDLKSEGGWETETLKQLMAEDISYHDLPTTKDFRFARHVIMWSLQKYSARKTIYHLKEFKAMEQNIYHY